MRTAGLALCAALCASSPAVAQHPLAFVFDGPTICEGCADPFLSELRRRGYEAARLKSYRAIPAALRRRPAVFVIPGGEDAHVRAQAWDAATAAAIRSYVRGGGAFVGVCLGAYWAADWKGEMRKGQGGFEPLRLTRAHVAAHTPGRLTDGYVAVNWEGKVRQLYYQDGPEFELPRKAPAKVLARYGNGKVAAFVSRSGRGKVVLSGVHVEADRSWAQASRLSYHPSANLFRRFLDLAVGASRTAAAGSRQIAANGEPNPSGM